MIKTEKITKVQDVANFEEFFKRLDIAFRAKSDLCPFFDPSFDPEQIETATRPFSEGMFHSIFSAHCLNQRSFIVVDFDWFVKDDIDPEIGYFLQKDTNDHLRIYFYQSIIRSEAALIAHEELETGMWLDRSADRALEKEEIVTLDDHKPGLIYGKYLHWLFNMKPELSERVILAVKSLVEDLRAGRLDDKVIQGIRDPRGELVTAMRTRFIDIESVEIIRINETSDRILVDCTGKGSDGTELRIVFLWRDENSLLKLVETPLVGNTI
jgi:hypothetical protein